MIASVLKKSEAHPSLNSVYNGYLSLYAKTGFINQVYCNSR